MTTARGLGGDGTGAVRRRAGRGRAGQGRAGRGRDRRRHARAWRGTGRWWNGGRCDDDQVPTLNDLARRAQIVAPDAEWLHALVSDWELLADLSFADLVLWAPLPAEQAWIALAQVRPTTGPTAFPDDVVGSVRADGEQPLLDAAVVEGRICREGDPDWRRGVPVRHETIPVCRSGRVLAVIERSTNLDSARTPSRMDLAFLRAADDLAQMIAAGLFPCPASSPTLVRSPRVTDGMVRLGRSGKVGYASPNALSAYRRLGLTADLAGRELGPLTARLCASSTPRDDSLMLAASGRAHLETEIEANGSVVQMRAIPLVVAGVPAGALILLRDVSELRHRERELTTKDATIREIHHRVKNNLQTVAALLRLQARRMRAPEAAAALDEAVRRVGSIALVHETLSQATGEVVDFDDIARQIALMAGELSAPEAKITPVFAGRFGMLSASVATPLALVLTELLQNAVQHGLAMPGGSAAGTLELTVDRRHNRIAVTVADNGSGFPPGFDLETATSLGLQIVRTLVVGELGGTLVISARAGGGTSVQLDLPLPNADQVPAQTAQARPGQATVPIKATGSVDGRRLGETTGPTQVTGAAQVAEPRR
jgi:two-component system, sensor histidine kinase PdtaS